jgi:hypothetical protein
LLALAILCFTHVRAQNSQELITKNSVAKLATLLLKVQSDYSLANLQVQDVILNSDEIAKSSRLPLFGGGEYLFMLRLFDPPPISTYSMTSIALGLSDVNQDNESFKEYIRLLQGNGWKLYEYRLNDKKSLYAVMCNQDDNSLGYLAIHAFPTDASYRVYEDGFNYQREGKIIVFMDADVNSNRASMFCGAAQSQNLPEVPLD